MAAMTQLSARTCLKMLRKLIHASQGEFGVAMVTGHPGHMLVLIVTIEPRGPEVTGVTHGALVTAQALVYPRTSNRPNGISWVSLIKKSRLSALFVVVGRVGGGDDTTVYERGREGATRGKVRPESLIEGRRVHCHIG
jgi:hypothetical protein